MTDKTIKDEVLASLYQPPRTWRAFWVGMATSLPVGAVIIAFLVLFTHSFEPPWLLLGTFWVLLFLVSAVSTAIRVSMDKNRL
jgi:hypothetical protein